MAKKKRKEFTTMDFVRASRRGSREAELENSCGFKSVHKAHKNKKAYNRKEKHRFCETF